MPPVGGSRRRTLMHRTSALLGRASVLVAVAATGFVALALGVAAPAHAEAVTNCGNGPHVVCQTVCREKLAGGVVVEHPEGAQVTVTYPDGHKETFTCRNGNWVAAAGGAPPARNVLFGGAVAVLTR
jgi:hypothetical protein